MVPDFACDLAALGQLALKRGESHESCQVQFHMFLTLHFLALCYGCSEGGDESHDLIYPDAQNPHPGKPVIQIPRSRIPITRYHMLV